MHLFYYILRRLLLAIPMLAGIVTVLFILYNLIPVDPLTVIIPDVGFKNPNAVAAAEEKWGLNKSLPEQYITYLGNVLTGDLGTSFRTRKPVVDDLWQRLPATLELAICAMFFGSLGIPLGVAAGVWRNTFIGGLFDRITWLFSMLAASLPPFWLGLVLLTYFWYLHDIAPGPGRLDPRTDYPERVTGFVTVDSLIAGDVDKFREAAGHLVLPTVVLGSFTLATVLRVARAAIIEEMRKDYIRTARAKGLSQRLVVGRHAFRNVLLPLTTLLGLSFARLIGGAVMTEKVFNWEGLGQYLVDSSLNLDYPAIQGGTLLVAGAYILVNLIVDVLYAVFDPRVRYGND